MCENTGRISRFLHLRGFGHQLEDPTSGRGCSHRTHRPLPDAVAFCKCPDVAETRGSFCHGIAIAIPPNNICGQNQHDVYTCLKGGHGGENMGKVD